MTSEPDRQKRGGAFPSPAARREEGGFALLAALLVLVGLTALTAGGFLMSSTERRIAASYEAGVQAFYVAHSGLAQYLGTQTGTPDSESYTFDAGSADVEGTKLLDLDEGRSVWRVVSVGEANASGGTARRTLSRIAVLESRLVDANAAISSLSGVQKNGSAGTISGRDAASPGQCPGGGSGDVAGVATPVGGYTENGTGEEDGSCSVPDGSPDCLEDDGLADELNVDWAGIYNDGSPVPTSYDENNWPAYDPDEWPVVYVSGDLSVNSGHSGQGTLIVTGNLTMNGSFAWDGLVLVGGSVTSNGNNELEGSIVSGLNETLGMEVPASDIANGTKTFQYHSCYLQQAQQRFSYLIEKPGTWSESF